MRNPLTKPYFIIQDTYGRRPSAGSFERDWVENVARAEVLAQPSLYGYNPERDGPLTIVQTSLWEDFSSKVSNAWEITTLFFKGLMGKAP